MTIGYLATYTKKDGSTRNIRFVRASDLPEQIVTANTKGNFSSKRTLSEGMELVWDIDNRGYRTFNWNTVQGDVKKFDYTFDIG